MDKIFYKVVYHHIIYMCDFFFNLDDFFIVVCMSFHIRLVYIAYVAYCASLRQVKASCYSSGTPTRPSQASTCSRGSAGVSGLGRAMARCDDFGAAPREDGGTGRRFLHRLLVSKFRITL